MKTPLTVLKNSKDFKFLWFGFTLTVFGGWFTTIAVNLYIWNSYESAILSSLSLAISMIPTVIMGPLLGGIIDQVNKKITGITVCIMNCVILLIPIIFPNIYAICLFNFLNGIISCIKYPWINSFIPLVIRTEDLDNANSSISFSKTSGQLIMPLLSGILFATTSANMLYVLNIIFLFLALL